MIERLYIDNVRSFVNFEWKPARLALLLGPNGAGKTALLDVLAAVQRFVAGDLSASEAFPELSRTRWDSRVDQRVELDVRIGASLFRYAVVVSRDSTSPGDVIVSAERVECDGGVVVELAEKGLRLFRAGAEEAVARVSPTRSIVGALGPANPGDLRRFHDWIRESLWLFRPDPRVMESRLDRRRVVTAPWLQPDLSNFAAWFLPTMGSQPASMFKALEALRAILPGLVELYADERAGELRARFEHEGVTTSYSFDELSDGERVLVALHVVLHTVAGPGKVLLLDEPDNYLGLREIQPWLAELADRALSSAGPQAIVVSHNPEALNFLAPEHGWRLFRDGIGPSRIEKFKVQEALDPSEAEARGWDGRE